jgi:hypothetical protein
MKKALLAGTAAMLWFALGACTAARGSLVTIAPRALRRISNGRMASWPL